MSGLQFREALEQFQRLHREQQSDRDLDLVGQAITRALRQQQGGGREEEKGKENDGKEDKEGDEAGIEAPRANPASAVEMVDNPMRLSVSVGGERRLESRISQNL